MTSNLIVHSQEVASLAKTVITWKTQLQTPAFTNILLAKVSLCKTLYHIQLLSAVLQLSLTSDLHL